MTSTIGFNKTTQIIKYHVESGPIVWKLCIHSSNQLLINGGSLFIFLKKLRHRPPVPFSETARVSLSPRKSFEQIWHLSPLRHGGSCSKKWLRRFEELFTLSKQKQKKRAWCIIQQTGYNKKRYLRHNIRENIMQRIRNQTGDLEAKSTGLFPWKRDQILFYASRTWRESMITFLRHVHILFFIIVL